jgi:hypothetical protein
MIKRLLLGACFGATATSPAMAETDLFSGDQLRGFIDLRAGAADGEESWLDGGFGKARFGGSGDDWAGRLTVGSAALVWRPQLTWSLDGYLHLESEPHQDHAIDVAEAYLRYRAPPQDGWRITGRAGLFYPPVSLEHGTVGWRVSETITPSAINTWIGEEVKVIGGEASVRRSFGAQEGEATLALFGYNDTSGTLLSYRGWALHDLQSAAFADFPLPNRSPAWRALKRSQAPSTEPVRELDDIVGYYARLEWRPLGNLTLDILHYDNEGDRVSREDGQWSWETRFTNVGLRAVHEDTRLLAQIMTGQTIYGRRTAMGYFVDMDFRAAYLLLAHDVGRHTFAGRIDLFETIDRSFTGLDNNDEDGWAATAAYQIDLAPHVNLAVEAMQISSDRPSRADVGIPPEQDQTMIQSALRLSF